jgi:hypothetical protein
MIKNRRNKPFPFSFHVDSSELNRFVRATLQWQKIDVFDFIDHSFNYFAIIYLESFLKAVQKLK